MTSRRRRTPKTPDEEYADQINTAKSRTEVDAYCRIVNMDMSAGNRYYKAAFAQFQHLRQMYTIVGCYHSVIHQSFVLDETDEVEDYDDLHDEMEEMKCFDHRDFTISDVFNERTIQLSREEHPVIAMYNAADEIIRVLFPGEINFRVNKVSDPRLFYGFELGVRMFIMHAYLKVEIPDHVIPDDPIREVDT